VGLRVVLANKFLYPKGGAERAVLGLGAELTRRGHAVAYFGMDHPDNSVPAEASAVVRRRDYYRGGGAARRDALQMIYSWEARRSFARLLDRHRPDVVHLHNIYHQLTPSILDAARDRGIPAVMTLHDYKLVCPRYDLLRHGQLCDACVERGPTACLRYRCAGGSWGASALLAVESLFQRARGSYDYVRLLLAPSRFLAGVLVRAGFDPHRLRHLPNFVPEAPPPTAAVETDRILYAGRLSPEKGIETLVQAAAGLSRGRLVVCGDGPLRGRLEDAAAAAPPGRIELRGHLDRAALAAELARAAFTAVPSEWFENAPFAVLESMAAGRAVIASRLGGLPELVRDGETGRLLPAGDVGAWQAALAAAFAAPDAWRRMGETARVEATARWSLAAHVSQVEDLYREVAA